MKRESRREYGGGPRGTSVEEETEKREDGGIYFHPQRVTRWKLGEESHV